MPARPLFFTRDRLVAYCAAGLSAGTLVWGVLFWYLTVPSVVVPTLAGLSIEKAREKASDYGVAVEDAQWIHHPAAHEGEVIAQSIQPGARVRHGRRIELTVSRGQNLVPVPYLRTRPVALAVASLDLLRLQIHVANTAYDEWVNAGAISWQDPRPGSLVPADTVVTVVVSRGPPHHAARTEDAAR